MANIIFLDQDKDVRTLYAKTLEEGGHNVKTLKDGEELINVVEKMKPQVVVVGNTSNSSLDVAADVYSVRNVPVILEINDCLSHHVDGISHFFSKSSGPDSLIETVNGVLKEYANVHL